MMDNNTAVAYINNLGRGEGVGLGGGVSQVWFVWNNCENVIADKNWRMFEQPSEWKRTEDVFIQKIVGTLCQPDIHLFASRINHQLSIYILETRSWGHGC